MPGERGIFFRKTDKLVRFAGINSAMNEKPLHLWGISNQYNFLCKKKTVTQIFEDLVGLVMEGLTK